ncbi:MAG: YlxR family protein [Clostridia bacterium]|nr:YlxR family protein [Clostridia bacterium]
MAVQNLKEKKVPSRRCVGCGEHFPKGMLVRIVKTPEGNVVLDKTGKAAGRGAYICPNVSCLAKAQKAHRLESSCSKKIESCVSAALEANLNGEDGRKN